MRDLVHTILHFVHNGEASLSEVRGAIRDRFSEDNLPRNWKVQVRDALKHDPEIEKAEDDTWVLRAPGAFEA